MKLTVELFKERACNNGYKWFKKHYPKGVQLTKTNLMLYAKMVMKTRRLYAGLTLLREGDFLNHCFGNSLYQLADIIMDDNELAEKFNSKCIWGETSIPKQVEIFWKLYEGREKK